MQDNQNVNNSETSSWDLFTKLEAALEASQAEIPLHSTNYQTISNHYGMIISHACEEIQAIYHKVSGKMLEANKNIKDYIHSITSHCSDFFESEVHMPMHDKMFKPWGACATGDDPDFWKTYHKIIQHEPSAEPTQEQAIRALAALFSLLLAFE